MTTNMATRRILQESMAVSNLKIKKKDEEQLNNSVDRCFMGNGP